MNTIPDKLKHLASFIREYGLADTDIVSASAGKSGHSVQIEPGAFTRLGFDLAATCWIASDTNTHHVAKRDGIQLITLVDKPNDYVPDPTLSPYYDPSFDLEAAF